MNWDPRTWSNRRLTAASAAFLIIVTPIAYAATGGAPDSASADGRRGNGSETSASTSVVSNVPDVCKGIQTGANIAFAPEYLGHEFGVGPDPAVSITADQSETRLHESRCYPAILLGHMVNAGLAPAYTTDDQWQEDVTALASDKAKWQAAMNQIAALEATGQKAREGRNGPYHTYWFSRLGGAADGFPFLRQGPGPGGQRYTLVYTLPDGRVLAYKEQCLFQPESVEPFPGVPPLEQPPTTTTPPRDVPTTTTGPTTPRPPGETTVPTTTPTTTPSTTTPTTSPTTTSSTTTAPPPGKDHEESPVSSDPDDPEEETRPNTSEPPRETTTTAPPTTAAPTSQVPATTWRPPATVPNDSGTGAVTTVTSPPTSAPPTVDPEVDEQPPADGYVDV